MEIQIEFDHYRCFGKTQFVLKPGFHAITGLNNAGKSALLRCLYELRPYFRRVCGDFRLFHRVIESRIRGVNGDEISAASILQIPGHGASWSVSFEHMAAPVDPNRGKTICAFSISHHTKPSEHTTTQLRDVPKGDLGFQGKEASMLFLEGDDRREGYELKPVIDMCAVLNRCVYIPASRGLNTGSQNGQTWFDVPIGKRFIENFTSWHSAQDQRQRAKIVELERRLSRLLGFPDLRISPVPERNDVHVQFGDQSRQLDEIGTGISQIIVTAFTVAMAKPSFLLIDEPESNLHPALQEQFLTLLGDYTEYGVIFATHSLGLARSVADSVSFVRRSANGLSEVVPLEDPSVPVETLGALQHGAHAMIGMECVLLVEGPHDVRTVRQWLRVLGKDPKVLVVPLGGTAMIRDGIQDILNDYRRFGSPVAALIDSERASQASELSPKIARFRAACNALSIPLLITERRAIENYITRRAAEQAFEDIKNPVIGHFDPSDAVPWGKTNSWRAAHRMTRDELMATDVGRYLESLPDAAKK